MKGIEAMKTVVAHEPAAPGVQALFRPPDEMRYS
jgi:hypothetical protein